MYFTYCKACVTEELKKGGAMATTLTQGSQTFKEGKSMSQSIYLEGYEESLYCGRLYPG
jgi:hypothetical protein